MSEEKTDFTINVKVNGLEDVERLRKALEGITTGTKHPGPGNANSEVRVDFDKPKADRFRSEVEVQVELGKAGAAEKFRKGVEALLADPEPELPTFKVGETHYRIASESVPVVQAAIRSALSVTNPWVCAEMDRFQRFTYRGRAYTIFTGLDAIEVKPTARFKVGDTVRLKSGGLSMTVVELRPDDMVYTASRHTGEPQRHAYPAACLEVVS